MEFSIDTSSTKNVPGALPNSCPNCQIPFSQVLKPQRKMQAKAKILFVVGLLGGMGSMPFVYEGILNGLAAIGVRFVSVMVLGLATVAVSGIPGYLLGSWALRFPRVVRMECGWRETFLVDRAGKVIS